MRIFRYRRRLWYGQYLVHSFVTVVFSGFGIYAIVNRSVDINYLYFGAVCLLLSIFAICLLIMFHIRHRPICVSSTNISAILFIINSQRRIPWSNIRNITNIRYFNQGRASYVEHYRLYGVDGNEIEFDDGLQGLRQLLDIINNHMSASVDLVRFDRGPDTVRQAQARIDDPQERRRLSRQGVITKLQRL